MKKLLFIIALICLIPSAHAQTASPLIQLDTSMGSIVLELNPQAAPKTAMNFIRYVESGFYNGTIFHRVIKGFMIQGGGFTADMQRKPTQAPIPNEAFNGLKNTRGTIAMARTTNPHSATSQFFINTVDNGFLDHKSKTQQGWGYCVFGKVVKGMDVIGKIEGLPTRFKSGHQNVPIVPVTIDRAFEIQKPAEVPSSE